MSVHVYGVQMGGGGVLALELGRVLGVCRWRYLNRTKDYTTSYPVIEFWANLRPISTPKWLKFCQNLQPINIQQNSAKLCEFVNHECTKIAENPTHVSGTSPYWRLSPPPPYPCQRHIPYWLSPPLPYPCQRRMPLLMTIPTPTLPMSAAHPPIDEYSPPPPTHDSGTSPYWRVSPHPTNVSGTSPYWHISTKKNTLELVQNLFCINSKLRGTAYSKPITFIK